MLLRLETENALVLPASAPFRTRFNDNNANKKVGQCHETVIRSFSSSSSGSFTSATPDGNRMNAANGALDEAVLSSPQVVAPVRAFTKVRFTLKNHEIKSIRVECSLTYKKKKKNRNMQKCMTIDIILKHPRKA